MNLKEIIVKELKEEAEITKKFLERYPSGKNDYKPHEKSMGLMQLTNHVVEIIGWPHIILNTDALDFAAGDYQPGELSSKKEFTERLEDELHKSILAIESTNEETFLQKHWAIKMGDKILAEWTKYGAIRHALNQETHHRAQLGVYYRLLDIPVPGSYGPSADEKDF